MLDTDKAYIAGIIDGEGSIGLLRNHHIQKDKRTPSYVMRVRVKMTDEMIVRWLHSMCGGRFYSYVSKNRKWKPVFEWIYPFLRIKKPQADLAIEFTKTLYSDGHGTRISDDIVRKREILRDKMANLNRRGSLTYDKP